MPTDGNLIESCMKILAVCRLTHPERHAATATRDNIDTIEGSFLTS